MKQGIYAYELLRDPETNEVGYQVFTFVNEKVCNEWVNGHPYRFHTNRLSRMLEKFRHYKLTSGSILWRSQIHS